MKICSRNKHLGYKIYCVNCCTPLLMSMRVIMFESGCSSSTTCPWMLHCGKWLRLLSCRCLFWIYTLMMASTTIGCIVVFPTTKVSVTSDGDYLLLWYTYQCQQVAKKNYPLLYALTTLWAIYTEWKGNSWLQKFGRNDSDSLDCFCIKCIYFQTI